MGGLELRKAVYFFICSIPVAYTVVFVVWIGTNVPLLFGVDHFGMIRDTIKPTLSGHRERKK